MRGFERTFPIVEPLSATPIFLALTSECSREMRRQLSFGMRDDKRAKDVTLPEARA
jgi:small neutral amino acid transporter SnatA (MarC family)